MFTFPASSLVLNIPNNLVLGQAFGGGYIGYIYQPGDPGYDADRQHGLIVYESPNLNAGDYSCSYAPNEVYAWGKKSTQVPYSNAFIDANATAIGTGYNNTKLIANSYPYGSVGVDLCATAGAEWWLINNSTGNAYGGSLNLKLNGYRNWFIPSREEMSKIWQNRTSLPYSLGTAYPYWTSSEYDIDEAWGINSSGAATRYIKNEQYGYMLPARYF